MVNMAKKEPLQGVGRDPFTGFPDVLVKTPWQESQAAPGEEPRRPQEPVADGRLADSNDYPEYYLG